MNDATFLDRPASLETLAQDAHETTRHVVELERRFSRLSNNHQALGEQLKAALARIDSLESSRSEAAKTVSDLDSTIRQVDQRMTRSEKLVADTAKMQDGAIGEINQRITRNVEALTMRVLDLESTPVPPTDPAQLAQALAELKELRADVEDITHSAVNRHARINGEIGRLQTHLINGQQASVKRALDLDERIAALEKRAAEQPLGIRDLNAYVKRGELQAVSDRIDELRDEVNEIDDDVSTLDERANSHKDWIDKLINRPTPTDSSAVAKGAADLAASAHARLDAYDPRLVKTEADSAAALASLASAARSAADASASAGAALATANEARENALVAFRQSEHAHARINQLPPPPDVEWLENAIRENITETGLAHDAYRRLEAKLDMHDERIAKLGAAIKSDRASLEAAMKHVDSAISTATPKIVLPVAASANAGVSADVTPAVQEAINRATHATEAALQAVKTAEELDNRVSGFELAIAAAEAAAKELRVDVANHQQNIAKLLELHNAGVFEARAEDKKTREQLGAAIDKLAKVVSEVASTNSERDRRLDQIKDQLRELARKV